MSASLKPLSEQSLVITGASSGIGLATARAASAQGAKLLLVARNEQALRALCDELRAAGGIADYVAADVADAEAIRGVARRADELYGGFDTWVNNAGSSIFADITDTPLEDQRRLFDVNYWGVVNGSLTAVEHLKGRPDGGTLINVGSILSDMSAPIQGVYAAAKHAVKGFTNSLRIELSLSAPKIAVTLIKPAAIDTPYASHARNYTGEPKKLPPPLYSVDLVAEAILYAAATPVREITVGGAGRLFVLLSSVAPGLVERVSARAVPFLMKTGARDTSASEALHKPGRDLQATTPSFGVRQTSLYTAAQMNPRRTAAVVSGALAVGLVLLKLRDGLRLASARRDAVRRYKARLEARRAEPQ